MVCWLGNVWACCCCQGVKHTRSFIQKIQFHFLQLHGLFKIWDRVWFYVMYCTLTLSDAVLYIVQKCVHDVKCLCEYAKMLLYQIFKKEKLSVMKSWCEYELSWVAGVGLAIDEGRVWKQQTCSERLLVSDWSGMLSWVICDGYIPIADQSWFFYLWGNSQCCINLLASSEYGLSAFVHKHMEFKCRRGMQWCDSCLFKSLMTDYCLWLSN